MRARRVERAWQVLGSGINRDDPIAQGRHKAWGSHALWIPPQTSTIASHLPKAMGLAFSLARARRIGVASGLPDDAIVICSFGDASVNHSTAQGAFNTAGWTSYQQVPLPLLFVCEDNGIGISVKTPGGWVARNFGQRPDLDYFHADGLDLASGYGEVQRAVEHCRRTRRPTRTWSPSARRLSGRATCRWPASSRAARRPGRCPVSRLLATRVRRTRRAHERRAGARR